MSVVKRGKVFHIRIRPFGPELITVRTQATTKSEAQSIERAILTACRVRNYSTLDPASQEVCVTMFRNRGLEIPPDLLGGEPVREELTFWRAIEVFLNYPTIKDCKARDRCIRSLRHVV